jgi:putative peptidoglycan lipid II flippase
MAEERDRDVTRFTVRSATYIGSFTLAARVVERLGAFAQIVVIASIYGSSFIADRYFIASIVPLIIGAILGEAFSANILVALVREGRDAASLVAAGFWLATGLLTLVSAAYVAAAAVAVWLEAPAGSTELSVWLAFAPIGILLGLSGYLSGVLTYFERYAWPPFRSAIATVGGFGLMLLVLVFTRDLVWVAAAVTTGYAASFLALLVETRRAAGRGVFGFPPGPAFANAFAFRRGLGWPVLGGLLGGQVFVLLERALASTIGVGAVSTLSYARGVAFTPMIVSQSIALGIYPGLLRAYEAGEHGYVRGSLMRGFRLTLFLALVLGGFFALFGPETIDVLLERGAFDPRDSHRVGTVLALLSLALVGSMLMVFFARVFYALDYFRAVAWTQLCALVVYVAIALPFRATWGVSGLAAAFGVAEIAGAVVALTLAARRTSLSAAQLREVALPAAFRAALVLGVLGLLKLAFAGGALDSSSLLRFALALLALAGACLAVLWTSGWPELVRVKLVLRRLVPVR